MLIIKTSLLPLIIVGGLDSFDYILAEPRGVLLVDNNMEGKKFTMMGSLVVAELDGTWTKRFLAAAIVQGAISVGLTVFLVLGQASFMKPEVSRVMAAGGAGTWFTFGYVMYLIVGVIGVGVAALFYHYLESVLGKQVSSRGAKTLAWTHLILMNVGTIAATGMLMYAGYAGGASMLPPEVGGKGFNAGEAHEAIMASFVEPISAGILIIVAGVIAGGIGFLVTYRRSSSNRMAVPIHSMLKKTEKLSSTAWQA